MRFARKLVEVAGDANNPLVVSHTGTNPDEVVHFYLPPNGRDQPEDIEADEPAAIEGGKAEEAA
jgi:hypothetical protein